jgi:hypothetical protein
LTAKCHVGILGGISDEHRLIASWEGGADVQNKYVWAVLAIAAMWIAVLFVGVYGPDIESTSPGGSTSSVPVAVVVAGCAMIGTILVAIFGFRK